MGTHVGLIAEVSLPSGRRAFLIRSAAAVVTVCLALLVLLPVLFQAVTGWVHDPLRSIGILLPIAAVVFLVRAIREYSGAWKPVLNGLWLAAMACAIVLLDEYFEIHLSITSRFQFNPIPVGFAISLLLSGALVMFGGWKLLRACLFPVALAAILNPIPHAFNDYLDLPLQVASASAARSFAHLIHEYPTGQQLQLMFTPQFGMFIAPGCNGIRGAIALGLLALFAAVWRRYRPWQVALYCVGGLAAGYLFNFLRLFVLVLYYKLGQSWPAITPWGTQVDYAIGGALFLLASFALGSMVFQTNTASPTRVQAASAPYPVATLRITMSLLCLLCVIPAAINVCNFVRQTRHLRDSNTTATDQLPLWAGHYQRVLEWNESSDEGIRMYHWGNYSNGNAADDVALGVWVQPTDHDVRRSRAMRGDVLTTLVSIDHSVPMLGTITYSVYRYIGADGSPVALGSLSCPGCANRVIAVDHHIGPLHAITADPTNYFKSSPARSAVLVHKGSVGQSDDELRRPLQVFLNSFDERSLFRAANAVGP